METTTTKTLYKDWTTDVAGLISFWQKNEKEWTDEKDAQYRILKDKADKAWLAYKAQATGLTEREVAAAENDAIHSRFD